MKKKTFEFRFSVHCDFFFLISFSREITLEHSYDMMNDWNVRLTEVSVYVNTTDYDSLCHQFQ